MAFPKKTSSEAIRTVAIDLLEKEGEAALTIRRVASELGLAANALYGHFGTRDILVAAVADEVAKRLLVAINDALAKLKSKRANPERDVRTLIEVYIKFARSHPALYQTLMIDRAAAEVTLPKPLGHDELWLKVVEILTPIAGLDNVALAAVTLWSFVHGMLALERANLLGGKKPGDVSEFGTVALLKGFTLCKKSLILVVDTPRKIKTGLQAFSFLGSFVLDCNHSDLPADELKKNLRMWIAPPQPCTLIEPGTESCFQRVKNCALFIKYCCFKSGSWIGIQFGKDQKHPSVNKKALCRLLFLYQPGRS